MTARGHALVLAADESYARGLAVAMHSAVEKLPTSLQIEIFVLDNGLSRDSRRRLLKIVTQAGTRHDLHWIHVPPGRLAHLAGHARFPTATYGRLLIPELLPVHVKRAVYLDSDVLVRRDVSPLFEIELGDAAVAAVRDASITSTAHEMSGVRDPGEPRPYFNGGVLVMDVPRWRNSGLGEHALRYAAAEDGALPWADQDALNAVVDRWCELEERWNVQHGLSLPSSRFRTAAVWHFIGGKPWNPQSQTPGTVAWLRALIHSGWYTRREAIAWVALWLGARAWLDRSGRPRWRRRLAP